MHTPESKRTVALEEHRCELHAIRLDALAAVSRAFDEVEGRIARLEKGLAASRWNREAA